MRRFGSDDRIALLMHGHLDTGFGKLGQGMLRYSEAKIVALIDSSHVGGDSTEITGILRHVPIVGTVAESYDLGARVLIVGIAPPGGRLPEAWWPELRDALRLGMSLVNPLHGSWEDQLGQFLGADNWIWDIRVEPEGLEPGVGAAAGLSAKRLLTVGSDMSVGKMTAALECVAAAGGRGISTRFLATGQVGICIAGTGVPLDAVRLDYAAGVIEREVVAAAQNGADVVVVEGQGALNHPASTASLALMRGSMPTHLLFAHRARQQGLKRMEEFSIPPIRDLIELNERVAASCGCFPAPKTIGVALNTAELSGGEALEECERLAEETCLPVSDPVRHGCGPFLDALLVPTTAG
ncbi:MAG: DUF1611 domain-containing protein [Fimbriimonadales bacterium]